MLVYIALGMGTVIIGAVRALLFFAAALRGSSKMHDTAFRAVAQASPPQAIRQSLVKYVRALTECL
jgi:hypothetical protein